MSTNSTGGNEKKRRRFPTQLFWILGTFLILAIGLTVIAIFLGLNHPYFKVDNYIIEGNISKSDEEISSELNIPNDESIFTIEVEDVENKVLNMGNFESVDVNKVIPDTLTIDIVEDRYIGYIQVDNGYLLVGANLKVEEYMEYLEDEEKEDLIKISNAGYDSLTIGNDVSSLDREMEFLRNLTNHVLSKITKEVDFGVDEGKVILTLKPDITVYFGKLEESEYKIALLEKVVSDIQSKDLNAVEIILDGTPNPVVVTGQGEEEVAEEGQETEETESPAVEETENLEETENQEVTE